MARISPTGVLRRLSALVAVFVISGCEGLLDSSEPGNLVPRTVDEGNIEHAEHAITLNGSMFHVESYGDSSNPAIIFFHGGPGGDSRSLLRLKERYSDYSLTDEYYLVYWDQRGSGLSQRHNRDALTLENYAEDARLLIGRFGRGEPVIVIGHSWGGMYATMLINSLPDLIRGAVLLEPGPITGELYESIRGSLSDVQLTDEWINDLLWNTQFLSSDNHVHLDYQMLIAYKESQPEAFHLNMDDDPAPFWRPSTTANAYIEEELMEDGVYTFDFTTQLERFTPKVLILVSGNNTLVGKEFQGLQAMKFPTAEVKVVPECGHNLMWTKPAETQAFIRAYVSELNQ